LAPIVENATYQGPIGPQAGRLPPEFVPYADEHLTRRRVTVLCLEYKRALDGYGAECLEGTGDPLVGQHHWDLFGSIVLWAAFVA